MEGAYHDKVLLTSHHVVEMLARIPFELQNACSTFQQSMDVVSSPNTFDLALIYSDDIFVLSWNANKHVLHVGLYRTLPLTQIWRLFEL